MKLIVTSWMMPWIMLRFTSTVGQSMDELTFDTGRWSDRSTRQAMQLLSPDFLDDGSWPEQPVLPTPTDVPVPEPFDIPVPEPIDVPPPEPRDVPPPDMPEFDPQPRPIP